MTLMGHDILLNKKDFVLIRFFLLKNLFNNFRKNKTKQLTVYRKKQRKEVLLTVSRENSKPF